MRNLFLGIAAVQSLDPVHQRGRLIRHPAELARTGLYAATARGDFGLSARSPLCEPSAPAWFPESRFPWGIRWPGAGRREGRCSRVIIMYLPSVERVTHSKSQGLPKEASPLEVDVSIEDQLRGRIVFVQIFVVRILQQILIGRDSPAPPSLSARADLSEWGAARRAQGLGRSGTVFTMMVLLSGSQSIGFSVDAVQLQARDLVRLACRRDRRAMRSRCRWPWCSRTRTSSRRATSAQRITGLRVRG